VEEFGRINLQTRLNLIRGVDDITINHGLLKTSQVFPKLLCKSLSSFVLFCFVLLCLLVDVFSKWFEVFPQQNKLMLLHF